MTVMISEKSQKVFFEKVFGSQWAEKYITPMLSMGVELKVSFVDITATYKNKIHKCEIGVSTSGLIQGTVPMVMQEKAKSQIIKFINGLHNEIVKSNLSGKVGGGSGTGFESWGAGGGGSGAIPVGGGFSGVSVAGSSGVGGASGGFSGFDAGPVKVHFVDPSKMSPEEKSQYMASFLPKGYEEVTKAEDWDQQQDGESLSDVEKTDATKKTVFESLKVELKVDQNGEIQPSKKAPAKKIPPKNVPTGVVKLRDAEVLGQRVYGTSANSIYTLIAKNERVKIGARVQAQSVSIRAEFKKFNQEEQLALTKIGLQHKISTTGDEYYSFHLGTGDVPVGRVLGAFLFDCGVTFEEQAGSIKEVKVDEGEF